MALWVVVKSVKKLSACAFVMLNVRSEYPSACAAAAMAPVLSGPVAPLRYEKSSTLVHAPAATICGT
eukprot:2013171-Prymnesium_polylepis.1